MAKKSHGEKRREGRESRSDHFFVRKKLLQAPKNDGSVTSEGEGGKKKR